MPELPHLRSMQGRRLWTRDRLVLAAAWPLLCLIVGMALWMVTYTKINLDRQAAIADAQRQLTSEVAGYSDTLSNALQKADQVLQLVRFGGVSGGLRLEDAAAQGVFPRQRQLEALILDRRGGVKTTSDPELGANFSQRNFFRFHRTSQPDVLRVSEPTPDLQTPNDGRSVIQLTRRISAADGSFNGVAAISIPLSYFNPSPRPFNHEDDDFSAVVGRDGVLRAMRIGADTIDPLFSPLARHFGSPPLFVGQSGSGALNGVDWVNDQQRRLYAWKALDDYPLIVIMGISEPRYLAGYYDLRRSRINTAQTVSSLLLALAILGTFLSVQLIARRRREENNRIAYRIATEGGKDGFFMFMPLLNEHGHMIDLQVIDCNVRGAAMLGHTRESMTDLFWSNLWSPRELKKIMTIYERAEEAEFLEEDTELDPDSPFLHEIHWIRRRIVRTGDMFAVAISDVTDDHRYREELVTLANQDLLTDLFNRNWLINTLPGLLEAAGLAQRKLAILFIDFDRFKQVNDMMGHTVGDELLKAAALRLTDAVRGTDYVVHLGGDEFLIILDPVQNETIVRTLADGLLDAFKQAFILSRGSTTVNLSIGITLYPRDGDSADTLLRNADLAMHSAKTHGRGQYRFYDAWLYEIVKAKLETESALRVGLERDEFLLHYQPRVSAVDGRLLGFEALIRWQQPGRGLVPPGEFIPLAEETGLIVELGAQVIEKACRQIADWRVRFDTRVPVSINVSARQFARSDVRGQLRAALSQNRLLANSIEIEITESSMLEQDLKVYQDLVAIRDMGIKILVDDFGTGYSSLSQLQRLELDVLKIDKSFVSELQRSPESEVIVNAIISMAHALHMTVVAEGVETVEQLRILQLLGCDEIQGYYAARPMTAEDAETCLANPMRYAALFQASALMEPPVTDAKRQGRENV